MLFHQSFKKDDSDLLYELNRKNKEMIDKLFAGYFKTVSFQSQSTIENYIEYYQFNDLKNKGYDNGFSVRGRIGFCSVRCYCLGVICVWKRK
jgi:hypothetical protein